jgi:Zn-dependent M28 family amino/carboxypeptidase
MRILLALVALTLPAEPLKFTLLDRERLAGWITQSGKDNLGRLNRVQQLFDEAGCETREQPVKGQKLPNLICEIPGPDDAILVIGAHYDKVDDSDGVIDNWTGATILPALYHALKPRDGTDRKHKILFVAFAEEEKGLFGSKFFTSQIKKTDRPHYQAMVNIDSLGLGPAKIWSGHNDQRLIELLGHVAASTNTQIGAINLDKVGLSDSFPFTEKKIPAIDFHSISQETWPILHTRRDNSAAFHMDDYWNSYRLIATYLAYLDQKLVPTPAPLP